MADCVLGFHDRSLPCCSEADFVSSAHNEHIRRVGRARRRVCGTVSTARKTNPDAEGILDIDRQVFAARRRGDLDGPTQHPTTSRRAQMCPRRDVTGAGEDYSWD